MSRPERVLVVAPFPPRRDGIAAYAAVQVQRLREQGTSVEVLSPPDGQGETRVPFVGGDAFRLATNLAPRFDRVLVHFQPSLYYAPRDAVSKVRTSLSLWRLAGCRNAEILVHEADPPIRWRPDYVILRRAFARAPRLWFHTAAEQRSLEHEYGIRVRGGLLPHAEGIRVSAPGSPEEARRRLGVGEDRPVFVCPGFIHPDKGYDRALSAFSRIGAGSLHVVGSVRDPIPANVAYASRLREDCARTPGAVLHEGFVSDGDLDAWISAADAVVLPYRRAWSSGMLARSQLLGTPAIVSRVGGLAEQANEDDIVIETDRDLEEALRAVAQRVGEGAR